MSGRYVGESQECVALVKKALPELGPTRDWREGAKINGPGDPPLEPGAAIATFKNGRYPNKNTGNHAGIFMGYGSQDGRDGIRVLDQFKENRAGVRFYPFARRPNERGYKAGQFSTIAK